MNEEIFTGKAEVYAKSRPTYPKEFIDYLYSEVGFNINSKIADIGAGTGILSKLLLSKNSNVICVEPNIDMFNIGKRDLIEFNKCSFIKATAEDTTLDENSIDFITVAQAFHWFDKNKFKLECKRILKNNGKAILVWNSRVETDKLIVETTKINKQFCPEFKGYDGGVYALKENSEAFAEFFKDGIYEYRVFNNNVLLDEKSFVGRNLSSSFAPKESSENYNEYINELKKLFDKHNKNGIVVMPYITRSYVGKIV